MINFTLSFEGNDSDNHEIDFYDVAQAMIGFQRSLAITTHLIINGEVITQSPSLKNARILAKPPEEGSWKIIATVAAIGTGAYHLTTTPKDTPLGHLVYSAYDYVISETMGFHVDYNQSLGQQYEKLKNDKKNQLPIIEQSQLDSVIEKCQYAVQEMHRPIVKSETASKASIIVKIGREEHLFKHPLDYETYSYIAHTEQTKDIEEIIGRISSYNINTFKGRIFVPEIKRPAPFILADSARSPACIEKITQSLTMNARDRFGKGHNSGDITCMAFRNISRTGRLKGFYIVEIK
jgi:hypothetical protein